MADTTAEQMNNLINKEDETAPLGSIANPPTKLLSPLKKETTPDIWDTLESGEIRPVPDPSKKHLFDSPDAYFDYLNRSKAGHLRKATGFKPVMQTVKGDAVSDVKKEVPAVGKKTTLKKYMSGQFPGANAEEIDRLIMWGMRHGTGTSPLFPEEGQHADIATWLESEDSNSWKTIKSRATELGLIMTPAFFKMAFQALPFLADMPVKDALFNVGKFGANVYHKFLEDWTDTKSGFYKIMEYDKLELEALGGGKPWSKSVGELFDQVGYTKELEATARELMKGWEIPEHEKDWWHHTLKLGVDWTMPGLGLPWMAGIRFFNKIKNTADDFLLSNYLQKNRKRMIDDEVPADTIEDELQKIKDAFNNAENFDPKTNTMTLPGGVTVKRYFDPSKTRKDILDMRYFNATMGATAMSSGAYAIMNAVPGWDQYKDFAMLAGFPGLFTGISGMARFMGKTPGAMVPVYEALGTAVGAPGAVTGLAQLGAGVLPPRWSWNYMNRYLGIPVGLKIAEAKHRGTMWTTGMFLEAAKREGLDNVLNDFANRPMGQFMRMQAVGVSIPEAISTISKGLDVEGVIAKHQLPAAAIKHLQRMVASMDDTQKAQLESSIESSVGLGEKLEKLSGLKGVGEHFFFIDQVSQLAMLSSQRNMVMAAAKFGDGPTRKFKPVAYLLSKMPAPFRMHKKYQMLTYMEMHNRAIEIQIGTLAQALSKMRINPKKDMFSEKERIKILERADEYIQGHLKQLGESKKVLDDFSASHKSLMGGIESTSLKKTMAADNTQDGLWMPEFTDHYHRNLFGLQEKAALEKATMGTQNDFNTFVRSTFRQAEEGAKVQVDKLYDKVNKELLVPMNNTIDRITEQQLRTNPVVRRMLGLKQDEITTEAFISAGRKNYLTMGLKDNPKAFAFNAQSLEGMGNSVVDLMQSGQRLTLNGKNIDVIEFEELLKGVEGNRAGLVELLMNLHSKDVTSQSLLNEIIPTAIKLEDALKLRTKQYEVLENVSGSAQYLDAVQRAINLDEILKSDLDDPISKLLMDKQGLTTADVAEQIANRTAAIDNYRETYAKVYKTALGRTLLQDSEGILKPWADAEKFLVFILPTMTRTQGIDEGIENSINVFNRLFPKSGTREIKNPDWTAAKAAEGSNLDEFIPVDLAALRQDAVNGLMHSIATMTVGPRGMEFIKSIDLNTVDRLVEEGILPAANAKNFTKYVKAIQAKYSGDAVEGAEAARTRLEKALEALPEAQKTAIERSFINNLSDKTQGTGLDVEGLIKSIVYNTGGRKLTSELGDDIIAVPEITGQAAAREATDAVQAARKELLESPQVGDLPATVGRIQTEATAVGQEIEKFERGARGGIRGRNIDNLLDSVGSSPEGAEFLDALQDVMMNWIYSDAFRFTSFQRTKGLKGVKERLWSGKERIKHEIDEGIDTLHGRGPGDRASLQLDVDVVRLSTNVDGARQVFNAIAKKRRQIADRNPKDAELRKAAKEAEDVMSNLEQILSGAVYVRGTSGYTSLQAYPTEFSSTQIISRVYSFAREVVGPQYLATEAMYRSWHTAHAKLLTNILFKEQGNKILYDIIQKQGFKTDADKAALVSIILKSFRINSEDVSERDMKQMMVNATNNVATLFEYIPYSDYEGPLLEDVPVTQRMRQPLDPRSSKTLDLINW